MKIYLLFILSIFISCSTNKAVVKTSVEEIRFGSGGGFTGKEITYTLNSNGKLTEGEKDLKQIDSKTTLLLFKEAKKNKIYSFIINTDIRFNIFTKIPPFQSSKFNIVKQKNQ